MSFGRNPHVAKAETAEQKARTARDQIACRQAWLEAARQWERAADRETDDKRRTLYAEKAEVARSNAEQPQAEDAIADDSGPIAPARKPTLLN
jgi:hypothetical protein